MAETVINLVQKLGILAIDEANYLSTVKSEVEALHTQLDMMKASLKDVDAVLHTSKRAKEWVKRLRSLSFEAEDLIDIFVYKVAQNRRDNVVKKTIKFPKFLIDAHQLRGNIEDLKGKIKMHFDDGVNYYINILKESQSPTQTHRSEIYEGVQKNFLPLNVVGLQTEEEELVKVLLEKEHKGVVSITGMGGLGKSTLANKIFHNDEVRKHFDCQAYVTISKEYSMNNILCKIIKQVVPELKEEEKKALASMEVENLEEKLFEILKNKKRYLIVLDDVWRKEDWDCLLGSFPVPHHGLELLLTTRNDDVARHADPNTIPYKKKFMDEQNSLNLFWKKFFCSEDDTVIEAGLKEYNNEVKNLAAKLVGKCDGLPLAILVLAGLLSERRQKRSFVEWKKVFDRVHRHLKEGGCDKVLSLSYTELPFHLKPCFLYFGVFPEDTEIERDILIQLWIAEGFVENSRMEDLGKEYLEELMQRNLIQVAKWKSNGEPESFIIHDLLLSLATSKAEEGMFLNISALDKALNCYHRVAIHDIRSDEENMADHKDGSHGSSSSMSSSNRLRSLLYFTKMSQSSLHGQFKLLNVLDLELALDIEELPKEIGKLFLLKYLRVRGAGLSILPCWVGNLSNLQTIDLTDAYRIRSIPTEILNLRKLRHLMCPINARLAPGFYDSIDTKDAFGICQRPHHNRNIGDLCDLQTLHLVVDKWSVDGLERLTSLKILQSVKVHRDEDIEDFEVYQKLPVALLELMHLDTLWIDFPSEMSPPSFSRHVYLYNLKIGGRMYKLLDHNDFPPNLTSLCLSSTHLNDDMMVVLERLPRLKELNLFAAYNGFEMKCSARGFPELESLFLRYFRSLQYWEVEKGAMPNLRKLELSSVSRLKCIPDGLRHITTLQELKLHMPEEFIERTKEGGDDWEKIKHIPSIHTSRRYW